MATCLNLLTSATPFLVVINGIFPLRLHFQKDARLLDSDQRAYVESKTKELATKLGISKPVELIEVKGLVMSAQALGVEILPGRIGIAIDPEIVNSIPKEQLEFLIAHELSHIKANDQMWIGVIGVISVITTLAVSILFPSFTTHFSTPVILVSTLLCPVSSPAVLIAKIVAYTSLFIFSKWQEECADKLGHSVCSHHAKRAAPKFFENIRKSQLAVRNDEEGSCLSKLWNRFSITAEGNSRLDVFHPSTTDRIDYLKT